MSRLPASVKKRPTATTRTIAAGCAMCHGLGTGWIGANAQALAAKHCDATGHPTWCDIALSIRYGAEEADNRQIDIEDAIREAAHG